MRIFRIYNKRYEIQAVRRAGALPLGQCFLVGFSDGISRTAASSMREEFTLSGYEVPRKSCAGGRQVSHIQLVGVVPFGTLRAQVEGGLNGGRFGSNP